ncbi:MAG: hypothetical protein ACI3ZO_05315 [Candidatus Cryptobacteroides sp.]|nr:hypothetical protein [Bacteroidales bacterium]
MDNSRKEKLEELINTVAELRERVDALEKQVEEYRLDYESSQYDEPVEMIDFSNEDFLEDIAYMPEDEPAEPVVEPEIPEPAPFVEQVPGTAPESAAAPEAKETEPEQEPVREQETEPEQGPECETEEAPPEPENDGESFSLFGEFIEPKTAPKPSRQRILNDANSVRATGAVIDQSAHRLAWLTDIPGPEVKDVRSAISLNDRVMFIGTLFREDSMLFQDVVSHINSMTSLDKAVSYLQETFPEWNMDSDPVYRFMMAVRRKIR